MLVHTYFLNLRNKAFEESGGWLSWETTERGLGNPAPLWYFTVRISFFFLQSFTCFPCKEFCLLSKKLLPCFSWSSLVSFFTKIHHADILLSSKYLRAAGHSLHCFLWNEFAFWHKSLCRVGSYHIWSPSTAGQVLSPVPWNHCFPKV